MVRAVITKIRNNPKNNLEGIYIGDATIIEGTFLGNLKPFHSDAKKLSIGDEVTLNLKDNFKLIKSSNKGRRSFGNSRLYHAKMR